MNSAHKHAIRKPVIQHVHELQKRITWALLAILAGGIAAYSVNGWLLQMIQRPLGQTLYYTSPMGGFNFMFKLCLVGGFILALPIILFQVFTFLGPLLSRKHRLTIIAYTLWSLDLAYMGLLFAYCISLPSALHFLAKFGGSGIESLITVDEYFNFALAYLAGFAILFQIPLLILFINKIKPLKPSKMMGLQRYVVLFSYIGAAMLTPTPDPMNQTIMALPAVALYQVGVILVWFANREERRRQRAVTRVARLEARAQKRQTVPVETPPVRRSAMPVAAVARPRTTAAAPVARPVNPPVDDAIKRSLRTPGRRMMDVLPPSQHTQKESRLAVPTEPVRVGTPAPVLIQL